MPPLEDWKKSQQAPESFALNQTEEPSKLLAQAIIGAWTQCPDGTAHKLKPGQTRAEVCGDQT